MMRLILSIITDREQMLKSYSPHLRACGGQFARLRRASRAPCLWLRPVSHARGWFRVQAHAELLFSRAGKRPGFCFLRLGKSPHQTFINEKNVGPNVPPRTETLEKAELCSLVFSSVSLISRRFAARRAAKPASSQKKGKISERAQASSFAQKRSKKLSSAPWLFRAFPRQPAVCGRRAA